MTFSPDTVRRYARHILLPDVGGVGQRHLFASSVAVVVDSSPDSAASITALLYLAAAGVGRLIVHGDPHGPVTRDDIEAGILYAIDDLGRSRVDAIADRIAAINPDVSVQAQLPVDDADASPTPLTQSPTEEFSEWSFMDRSDSAHPGDRVARALTIGGLRAARTLAHLLDSRHGEV